MEYVTDSSFNLTSSTTSLNDTTAGTTQYSGAMSDTSFPCVSQKSKLIDIIDDEWLQDCLSDDGKFQSNRLQYIIVDS